MRHSDYVNIIEGFGKKAIADALIKVAVKNLPLLASGPWGFLLNKVALKLAEELAQQAEMRIFFQYVDFRTDVQAKDFEAAMLKNHTMQQIGTPDEKIKAEAELIVALGKLMSLRS